MKDPIAHKTSVTYWVKIYIAGPLSVIEQVCRRECMQGLCVTVEPTRFIYTGGEETGAVIGLVNYPRFPKEPAEIHETALKLAVAILDETYQDSVLIMAPDYTDWLSKREAREASIKVYT